jgi:hypothetical protein
MSIDLFALLPAFYRIRDAQLAQAQTLLTPAESTELSALQALTPPLSDDQQAQLAELTAKASRGPLQSLLMLIGEQLAAVAYDIDQLYDDQFIETCAPWVIPYIGDLIGYQSIHGIAPTVDDPRTEVAETISLRRRKGTVLVLEQLARDVTAWGAHAVEMFRVLGDTQYVKHIRPANFYAPDLRRWQTSVYLNTAFDRTSHRVDVRSIARRRGRYNIQNVGIFLWQLSAYSVTAAAPTPAATNSAGAPLCYRFDSLGMDLPLFHRAVSQGEQITSAAQPVNVPDRLRRRVLCDDIDRGVGAAFYGPNNSLAIMIAGQLVDPYQLGVANLSGADGSWCNLPMTNTYSAVIDPELGRFALPPPRAGTAPPEITVSYYYGFNAPMGGGEYPRASGFTVLDPAWVFPFPDTATIPRYADLPGALQFAQGQLAFNGEVAIEVSESSLTSLTGGLVVDLPAGTTLEFRAADPARPTLLLEGEFAISGAASSTFTLNGLLLAASTAMSHGAAATLMRVPALRPGGTTNLLGRLNLTDCTLVPGWSVGTNGSPVSPTAPALIVESAAVTVVAERAILGSLRSAPLATISCGDSILDATNRTNVAYAGIDGTSGGGPLTLTGCTVVGKVHAGLLTLVSDSIIWAALGNGDSWASALVADRKQEGCVRFSFVPVNAVMPRNFECVVGSLASPQPLFATLRYGTPAYLKLMTSTAESIRRGADDGGEMGAYHWLLAPQREGDLRIRLREYLPVGLEFGLIYQS